MHSSNYNFTEFIKKIKNLNYPDIIIAAERECNQVESVSYRVRGSVQARKAGSTEYAMYLKEFLFYMRFGKKPLGVSDYNFQLYKIVAESLVAKGQFKESSLDDFKHV